MEENGINEDQVEPIIREFATYRLRHKVSYDSIIKSGREEVYLEQKFDVLIEKIQNILLKDENYRQARS